MQASLGGRSTDLESVTVWRTPPLHAGDSAATEGNGEGEEGQQERRSEPQHSACRVGELDAECPVPRNHKGVFWISRKLKLPQKVTESSLEPSKD